ncbi:MAG: TonB-dependent receptor [Xanthomonadales bacterium]|nr:TonB-dependent receptor [Xanthomonadales bacterium]
MNCCPALSRSLTGVLLALLLNASPLWAEDARLSLFVFQGGLPQGDIAVTTVEGEVGVTDDRGALFFSLPAGQRELVLSRQGIELLRLPLNLVDGELGQILVTLYPDGSPPRVIVDSSNQGNVSAGDSSAGTDRMLMEGDPGSLTGRVFSAESGEAVSGARIFISGTPLDLRTSEEGQFQVELPPGVYSISVMHGEHATLTQDGVQVFSEETTPMEIELVPAGLELPEFVVLEPFVEGSLASVLEEQRMSSGVANVLGAEAISRAGDSDAAGALKRVTGLTLVDGRYVYVRGLGERYSSALLNGANIPSPDPTRRVVPLSLFPADILASVLVQKSYEASMPAEFGGGVINLRTTGIPESTYFKVGFSTAWHDQSTWDDGATYTGGDDDFLGKDDGTRRFPNPDFEIGERTGQQLPRIYNARNRELDPDSSMSVTGGWRGDWDSFSLGAVAVYAYDQSWRNREEVRNSYFAFERDGEIQLTPSTSFDLDITRRFVNITNFLAGGIEIGDDHAVSLAVMRLRDSEDEVRVDRGIEVEGDFIERTQLEFQQRQLNALQLNGTHTIPRLSNLELSWLYSDADTVRDAPDTRDYRYTEVDDGVFRFNLSADGNARFYSDLEDQAENMALDLRLPLAWENWSLALAAGYNTVEKSRDSFIRRFRYECRERSCRDRELLLQDLESILLPINIQPDGGFRLVERTLSTDTYFANQDIEAEYLSVDATIRNKLRLYLGVRHEVFDQSVVTFDRFNTSNLEESVVQTDEYYPGVSATWNFSDATQLRFSYSETTTRPEFREASTSLYTDPELDIVISGNPELIPVDITNYDLRWERYFDTINNISVALFRKELQNPIELIFEGGSAQRTTVDNVESAEINGLEIKFYRSLEPLRRWKWFDRDWVDQIYLAGNYSYIDSSIEITEEQRGRLTNTDRELQGQSPYVFNLQVGYDNEDRGIKATLLYNVFGERISFVGAQGNPDIFEEPFNQLDFVYSQDFFDGQMKLGIKARNLLDEEVEFTQGDEFTRIYKKGREFSVGLDWRF